MADCKRCDAKGLIQGVLGDGKAVLLDPHAKCYTAVDDRMDWPEEGARLFLVTAMVEHTALCPAARRDRQQEREAGKRQREARDKMKRGA